MTSDVVYCNECQYNDKCWTQSFVRDEGIKPFDPYTFFCADAVAINPIERPHWIDHGNGWVSCSRCHTSFPKLDRFDFMHFCSFCGRKMEEA